jgi:hypothetical protein
LLFQFFFFKLPGFRLRLDAFPIIGGLLKHFPNKDNKFSSFVSHGGVRESDPSPISAFLAVVKLILLKDSPEGVDKLVKGIALDIAHLGQYLPHLGTHDPLNGHFCLIVLAVNVEGRVEHVFVSA